ncbi:MAG: TIGR03915 family putative DNA repair protein [Alistipes sp.]|jgi:probable DNA metabolism protein|nr:TIGR03915 family putative DNA repair protein [Alistipes sp.]
MIVFRYDKTLDGLLTVVFDAYSRRIWPEALLAPGEPAPMFTDEEHTVATDPEKARRVWRALEKKLPKDVLNMLVMGWLSEQEGVDVMAARFMRRVFDETGAVATDFRDPDVLRIKQLAQKVSREREHLMQFTRFQKGADAGDPGDDPANPSGQPTYFAPVSPRYNALPLAIPYFHDRFRDQRWLVYDISRHYGYYYDLHEVTEITLPDDSRLASGRLDPSLLAGNEDMFAQMWRGYIASMAIEERLNARLQRQHMPRRFWPLMTEMAGTPGTVETPPPPDLPARKRRR